MLAYGKEVTLQTHGKDKYRRTLADVFLSDGINLNHALVREVRGLGQFGGNRWIARLNIAGLPTTYSCVVPVTLLYVPQL